MDNYKKNIEEFGRQLTLAGLKSFNLGKLKNSRPESVIVVGMGGSGLAGDLLKDFKKEVGLKLPVMVWKDYGLPEENKNALYIFSSFSGNTEETLSGIKMLLKNRKRSLISVIATGGELLEIAKRNSLPLITFPAGSLTPRQSTGRMFYSLIEILRGAGLHLKAKDLSTINTGQFAATAKKLAAKLKNRAILIYTDQFHRSLGYIWKIKFNETAKNPAFANILPELNHNEIVSFEKSVIKSFVLFILDKKANKRVIKRFNLTKKLLGSRGAAVETLELSGASELEKAWRTIILADWTAYYLAKLNKTNPSETKIIDTLKRLMK